MVEDNILTLPSDLLGGSVPMISHYKRAMKNFPSIFDAKIFILENLTAVLVGTGDSFPSQFSDC